MELALKQIGKRYGHHVALQNLTMTLKPGVIGLLGPNGAGKSTLLRILATIIRPSEGQVTWNGVDIAQRPDEIRQVLGYLPQDLGLYQHLTALEFLEYMAAAKGLPRQGLTQRISDLLALVNLTGVARRPLSSYSGGMRQRVGVAQALLNNPAVLLMDEPSVGLDPEERVRLRHLLVDLAKDRIILLSTHIVSDIEAIADRVVMIHRGRLLADSAPEGILEHAVGRVWELVAAEQDYTALRHRWSISSAIRKPEGILLRVVGENPPSGAAQPVAPTLEDAYLLFTAADQRSAG